MKDLITALQIFLKYEDLENPTYCTHDELRVLVDPNIVSSDDLIELEVLGFVPNRECECFISYRFGSY